jgi:hypothetical protein
MGCDCCISQYFRDANWIGWFYNSFFTPGGFIGVCFLGNGGRWTDLYTSARGVALFAVSLCLGQCERAELMIVHRLCALQVLEESVTGVDLVSVDGQKYGREVPTALGRVLGNFRPLEV